MRERAGEQEGEGKREKGKIKINNYFYSFK